MATSSCGSLKTQNRKLAEPTAIATLDQRSPFLKAHLRNGQVFILSGGAVDTITRSVSGQGEQLDPNRLVLSNGNQRIEIDSVALFETNVVGIHGSVTALSVLTGISVAATAYCVANPKACFGSCPTFYASDGERQVLQAEGFSSSVAPTLEATDVDALYFARPSSRQFEVQMRNEALETQVVRSARILAVPRRAGGRTFASPSGDFWQASEIVPPVRCSADEGDCLAAVRSFDHHERVSTASATDLATREVIELEFPPLAGDSLGLVIASRQTLLGTYLFYQALAYMGRSAVPWLASLKRGDAAEREKARGIERAMGRVEVQVPGTAGDWTTVGEAGEAGPIATDVHVVPLGTLRPGPVRLRLRLARGHWRIDYVALARLSGRAQAVRLDPVQVRRGGSEDAGALAALTRATRGVVTQPGDRYTLVYRLPADFAQRELFLESRGYYLEWMRNEWLAEENPERAALMMLDPDRALRVLAPEFKKAESGMEDAFWRSRYVRR